MQDCAELMGLSASDYVRKVIGLDGIGEHVELLYYQPGADKATVAASIARLKEIGIEVIVFAQTVKA